MSFTGVKKQSVARNLLTDFVSLFVRRNNELPYGNAHALKKIHAIVVVGLLVARTAHVSFDN